MTRCIHYLQQQQFAKPLVPIIDREADAIGHMQENDYLWLLRAKNHTTVTFENQKQTCVQIANSWSFSRIRKINYHGKAQ